MSCSLYWKPAVRHGKNVGDFQLRDMLREEFGAYPITLSRDALPFLRGLAAAKIDGASFLIVAIEKHDSIELWTEC